MIRFFRFARPPHLATTTTSTLPTVPVPISSSSTRRGRRVYQGGTGYRTAYCYSPTATPCLLFCLLPTACTEPTRPPPGISSRYSSRKVGRATTNPIVNLRKSATSAVKNNSAPLRLFSRTITRTTTRTIHPQVVRHSCATQRTHSSESPRQNPLEPRLDMVHILVMTSLWNRLLCERKH